MRKAFLTVFFLVLMLALSLTLISCNGGSGESVTLYVYNWGEYISDGSEDTVDVNAEFERYCREELGLNVKVNYSTFSSNEDMYAKISSGSAVYDVVIPSDYMIQRMISENLLKPLDLSLIPNYAEARVLGKVRCPKYIGGKPEVNAVPGAAGKDTTYYVYATKNGAYYHIDEHCSGMQNAERVKLSDMLASNRPACPVCCTAVEMTVFVSRTSPYYHSYSGCSGLRDPMSDTLVHAMATGLERCPLCWQTADK